MTEGRLNVESTGFADEMAFSLSMFVSSRKKMHSFNTTGLRLDLNINRPKISIWPQMYSTVEVAVLAHISL